MTAIIREMIRAGFTEQALSLIQAEIESLEAIDCVVDELENNAERHDELRLLVDSIYPSLCESQMSADQLRSTIDVQSITTLELSDLINQSIGCRNYLIARLHQLYRTLWHSKITETPPILPLNHMWRLEEDGSDIAAGQFLRRKTGRGSPKKRPNLKKYQCIWCSEESDDALLAQCKLQTAQDWIKDY